MTNKATLKVGPRPDTLGTINDLVRNDEVSRLDSFLQTAHCGESNDGPDTNGSERCNVRARVHLVGRDLMVKTVTAKECDWDRFAGAGRRVLKDCDGRRRLAPGSIDVERSDLLEAVKFLQTGAADDSDADGV